jgi:DNA ligase-1
MRPWYDGEVRISSNGHKMKFIGGVYSCDCMGWKVQSKAIDKRTCKHLKEENGESFELARIGAPAPAPSPATATATPPGATTGAAIRARAAAQGRQLRPDEKAKLNGPKLLLANKFEDTDIDPKGWWLSVKLDGCRSLLRDNNFISRQGNVFHAPDFFKFPVPANMELDGELWLGRQSFEKTMSIVRSFNAGDRWKDIKYLIFDVPTHPGTFEERMAYLKSLVLPPHVIVHPHAECGGKQELMTKLKEASAAGEEGLMLRQPCSLYEGRRSNTLLKVKLFEDMEATVKAHEPGKGRHRGRLGGLIVVLDNGVDFHLGTGFSDAERNSPPPVGSRITFTYTGWTKDGVPKCTSFLRVV